jgi:hypothetical protein
MMVEILFVRVEARAGSFSNRAVPRYSDVRWVV